MRGNSYLTGTVLPKPPTSPLRLGNMLPFFIVLLPAMLGILGLVIDCSMMRASFRLAQNAADSAATAAAAAVADGLSVSDASAVAVNYVNSYNGLASANVAVQIPPVDGPYAGQAGFAEVQVSLPVSTIIIQVAGAASTYTVHATAVSGSKASTQGAAIVVLDPNPPGITLPAVAGLTLPSTPSLNLGGLEVLGLGQLNVDGAVLVDNTWGGVDQNGNPVGEPSLLRAAVTCMPLLPLTSMTATDIRVTGGVDNQKNYSNYQSGQASPLKCNQKPVPDPLINLPVPTTAVDPINVSNASKGGVTIVGLPLIGPPTTLQPGVYDYIQIATGTVVFESGVYIIRSTNPLTGIALDVVAGQVTANGVMFYITNSSSYSATTGLPDSANSGTTPDPLAVGNPLSVGGPLPTGSVPPSVVLNVGLLGSQFTPLTGTGSVYDGILFYQTQVDRRIMIFSTDLPLTTEQFSGTVYAKWGQVIFAGMGTLDTKFVVGSIRFVNVGDLTLKPSQLLPAAQDVYLVQ